MLLDRFPSTFLRATMIRAGLLILVLASLWAPSNSAASVCAGEPCTLTLLAPCSQAASMYRLYGECCSLIDIAGNDTTCLLTIGGNDNSCNYREPGYTCNPEQGCLPEWNVISAVDQVSGCPPSDYPVPLVQQAEWTTNSGLATDGTSNGGTTTSGARSCSPRWMTRS